MRLWLPKYTEKDYLNSIVNIRQINELPNETKMYLSELMFFCIGKSKSFCVSILNVELSKYYTSRILRQAIVHKLMEGCD